MGHPVPFKKVVCPEDSNTWWHGRSKDDEFIIISFEYSNLDKQSKLSGIFSLKTFELQYALEASEKSASKNQERGGTPIRHFSKV